MSARERVAKAIFEASAPGMRWQDLAPWNLEAWGAIADAALAVQAAPTRRCRACGCSEDNACVSEGCAVPLDRA